MIFPVPSAAACLAHTLSRMFRCVEQRAFAKNFLAPHAAVVAIAAAAALLLGGLTEAATSALPSFPGAEGYGSTTPGGRGGPVVKVTTLADSGPGSLRWALETLTGPRIVVFAVGGEVELASQINVNGEVTVAGQTSPGAGLTITGGRLHVIGDDVIIRGLRVRPGNGSGQPLDERDGISVGNQDHKVRRVVIDRNSVTWATDENLATWYEVEDVTFSNNIVAEALNNAGHSKGQHSMGILIGKRTRRISILRNLLASNRWRNPQIASSIDTEVINNFIFNFGPGGMSASSGPSRLDIVNNVYEAGPNTPKPGRRAAISLDPGSAADAFHVAGNLTPMGPDAVRGPGSMRLVKARSPGSSVARLLPAEEVKRYVLAHAGARVPVLDPVDERIVSDAVLGLGSIIDTPPRNPAGWRPPSTVAPFSDDSDDDGIPDAVELTLGTRPNSADSHLVDPASGYAFIELYVNGLFDR